MKLEPKFTPMEKIKYQICRPWLAKIVVRLPLPKKWRLRFVRWQIMSLADITIDALKRCIAQANKDAQEGDIASNVRLSDTASIETSSKWETSNDNGNGPEVRITARTRSVEEGGGDTRQD